MNKRVRPAASPLPPEPDAPPLLTPAIVADKVALSTTLDEAFADHPALRRAGRRIERRQGELRRLVSEAAWKSYLAVEEAMNARALVEVDLLVAWAFEQGRAFERAAATSPGDRPPRPPCRTRRSRS